MDRNHFYAQMAGGGDLDYEIYLDTKALLSCQKPFDAFCNRDELQFQIVHPRPHAVRPLLPAVHSPQLWEIRSQMTDAWGGTYGRVRDSIGE